MGLFYALRSPNPGLFLATLFVAVAVCITIHEFAHAKRADLAGDPTPRRNGRLSLNPIDHFDPIGTTMFFLLGFGWAKPVPVNPYNFRNPRRDGVMVALWGPLSNIMLAVALALIVRFTPIPSPSLTILMGYTARLSLLLAFFNVIPVPPLDGSHVLSGLLPYPKARAYDYFISRYRGPALLGAFVLGIYVAVPAADALFRLLI